MTSLALACRLGAGSPITLPRRVRAILAKYSATLLMPGPSGIMQYGFQPGNYRESTGQTLAAADQQVGLVVDAARVPGPELVANGDFSNGTTGWLEALGSGASISVASGSLRLTAGSAGARAYQSFPTVVGRSYRLSITKSGGTATQSGYRITSDATGGATGQIAAETALSGDWSRSLVFTATASNTTIAPLTAQSIGTADFDNISVRELPGIHASQPTSGFQPVLRRGLLNQLTWSSDFSQSAWSTKLRVSVSGATLTATETNGNGFLIGRGSATALGNTTVAFLIEKGTSDHCVVVLWDGTNGTRHWFDLSSSQLGQATSFGAGVTVIQASIANLPDGRRIISLTASIPSGTPQFILYPSVNSPTGFGCTVGDVGVVHAAATFQGTVTAEEIIAAGGIPVTTSAPASSANGVQSWQFDGTDDRLSLSAVPFQMADDHFVVAGINPSSSANDPAIFSVTSTTNNNPVISLGLLGTGAPRMWWRDDAGTFIQRVADDNLSVVGSNVVLSGVKSGSTGRFRKNGIPRGSIALSLGAATFNAATVGAFTRSTVTSFLNGHTHGVIFGKGAISDSELLTLERFMASLQGRTL